MPDNYPNGKNGAMLWRRIAMIIAGAFLSINTIILMTIRTDVVDMNNKIFTHLTNHDIHIPREQLVSSAEYSMFQRINEEKLRDVSQSMKDINKTLIKIGSTRR